MLDFRGSQGVKGQKIAQNEKKTFIPHAPYQEQYSIWSWVLVHILIFLVVNEVKGPEMVQNDKRLCTSSSFSQEPYIIWLSFMVHICKTIISPIVFFQFFMTKWNGPKWQKILSVALHISGTIFYMIDIYGTHDSISRHFFHFLKILIFWVIRGHKGQKTVQMTKNSVCRALYFRNHISYDQSLYGSLV